MQVNIKSARKPKLPHKKGNSGTFGIESNQRSNEKFMANERQRSQRVGLKQKYEFHCCKCLCVSCVCTKCTNAELHMFLCLWYVFAPSTFHFYLCCSHFFVSDFDVVHLRFGCMHTHTLPSMNPFHRHCRRQDFGISAQLFFTIKCVEWQGSKRKI